MKVKLVIDGREIELLPKGQCQGHDKFVAPKEMCGVTVSVFIRQDWRTEKKGVSKKAPQITNRLVTAQGASR